MGPKAQPLLLPGTCSCLCVTSCSEEQLWFVVCEEEKKRGGERGVNTFEILCLIIVIRAGMQVEVDFFKPQLEAMLIGEGWIVMADGYREAG